MRLKAAFDALRDPHQASLTIQDIARKAGYDSDAFFCRAFKSMFDVTPGELRRAAEMAAPKFAPQPGVDRRYEAWLHSRSEEHTSELQSLMRISYAVFCLKKKKQHQYNRHRLQ